MRKLGEKQQHTPAASMTRSSLQRSARCAASAASGASAASVPYSTDTQHAAGSGRPAPASPRMSWWWCMPAATRARHALWRARGHAAEWITSLRTRFMDLMERPIDSRSFLMSVTASSRSTSGIRIMSSMHSLSSPPLRHSLYSLNWSVNSLSFSTVLHCIRRQ